jgi:hypothetical protein
MKKQNLNEIKNNKEKELLDDWVNLFDSEKITFYDFNPEKETFSEACERIRKIKEEEGE